MPVRGYEAYQRIQTETATPAELILKLYERLTRDLERAQAALQDRAPLEQSHGPLVHAQEIVIELLSSLDMSTGDLATQLAAMYEYMYQRLVEANVHKDHAPVTEVLRLLRPIQSAWRDATQGIGAAQRMVA
jgi:flagellar protein FliS